MPLVFVTKSRHRAFTDPMLTRCRQIMAEVCDKFGATLTDFNAETDHVHLSIHYPSTVQLSTLVNSLKGVSARYLRQEFPRLHPEIPVGKSLLVTVLLRRLRRRSPTRNHRRVHHQPKRPEPTKQSNPATRDRTVQNQLPPDPEEPGFP